MVIFVEDIEGDVFGLDVGGLGCGDGKVNAIARFNFGVLIGTGFAVNFYARLFD